MIYVEIIASVGPGPHLRPEDSQKLTLRRSTVFVKVQLRKATSGSGCVCVCSGKMVDFNLNLMLYLG